MRLCCHTHRHGWADFVKSTTQGDDYHTLACRHTSMAHTGCDGFPGATYSIYIYDCTGQEEKEVDS